MACCQPKVNYNRQLARFFTFSKLPDKLLESTNPTSFLELSKQGLFCESDNETVLKCMFCEGDSKLKTGNFAFIHLRNHDEKQYKDDVPVEFTPLQAKQAFTELSRQRNTLSRLDFKNFLDEFLSRDYENDPSQIVLALQKSLFNSPDNTKLHLKYSEEDDLLRDLDHQETLTTGINDRTSDDNSSESTDIHVPTVNTVSQQSFDHHLVEENDTDIHVPTVNTVSQHSFDHHLVGESDTNETSLELVITSNVSTVLVSVQDISLSQQQPTLQQRLSTFRDLHVLWPSPERMAHSGFSYIGQGSVRCFSCGGVIDDWLPTDDPYTKHKGEFPNCHHIYHLFYVDGIPVPRSGDR
ncbi:hypothetical protein SNE40_019669 [Patella caerulea]|uniref:Uncharacterized protein n=1 Tax=Patella caerulea TaxID=87958 RepID=A0AAN8PG63_PATCE